MTSSTPPLAADEITPHLARRVLTEFRSGDNREWLLSGPSGGERLILDAILNGCDDAYLDRFALGFPGLVAAVRTIRRRGGVEELTSIARSDGQS